MSDRSAIFYYVASIQEGKNAEPVDLTRRVESFVFVDREAGKDKLSLTVDNHDLANFDDPLFETGSKLQVAWGNGITVAPPRDMVIKKVTGGRTLTVECETKEGSKMDTVKKRRLFASVSRSDVARKIAKETGFNDPDIEETPEVFAEISQGNLTDGQFLRKLAHLEGFEFFIDWEGMHWHRRRVGQAPVREYTYFSDPQGGEIIDFNIENDVTRRPAKVTVKSRDPITKETICATASNSEDADRDVMQGFTATVDGESGFLTLKKEIVEETTVASNVDTQADADREAKGKFRKASQGAVKMTLTVRSDPALVAKTIIRISNMGQRISGLYYVKEVTHALSASAGYDMSIKLLTDGFQKSGKKKGAGTGFVDSSASLVSLADELLAAIEADFTAEISGETGLVEGGSSKEAQVVKAARKLAGTLKTFAKLSGDQLRIEARIGAKAFRRLCSSALGANLFRVSAFANEAAAALDRIASGPSEIEAQGKKNTKSKAESTVTPVPGVDTDGNSVTTFVATGGRTK